VLLTYEKPVAFEVSPAIVFGGNRTLMNKSKADFIPVNYAKILFKICEYSHLLSQNVQIKAHKTLNQGCTKYLQI